MEGWPNKHIFLIRMLGLSWIPDRRKDTGYLIYKNYHKIFKSEAMQYYYNRKIPWSIRLLRNFGLDFFQGYPRKPSQWVINPYPLIDIKLISLGRWEQFFFKQEIFCVHMGMVSYAGQEHYISDLEHINNFLKKFYETQ